MKGDIVDIVVPATPVGSVDDVDALPARVRTPSVLNAVTPAQLLERMDRYGIAQSILPARRYGPLWGVPYEVMRDFVAAEPSRLFATAGIDPLAGTEGVRRFEEAVRDYGFVGAHTYPTWSHVPADDKSYYPYYAKAEELGVPFQIECMAGKRLPSMGHPRYFEQVAYDFPDLKIVATHTGYPWERELVAAAEFNPNFYIGADTLPVVCWSEDFKAFIRGETYAGQYPRVKGFVPHTTSLRVMFGSNYISMDLDKTLPAIDALGLAEDILDGLMVGNARRLYQLPTLSPTELPAQPGSTPVEQRA